MTGTVRQTPYWILVPCAVAALSVTPLAAQTPDDGGFEFSVTYGRNRDLVSVAEPFVAGLTLAGLREVRVDSRPDAQQNFGLSVSGITWRYLRIFTEFLHNDLGETRASARVPFVVGRTVIAARVRFYEWTGGAHLLLPTGTSRVWPYVGGGVGSVWGHFSARAEGVPSESVSARDSVYHGDVGVRVLLTRHIGLAPEFRLVAMPDETFNRVLINALLRFQ